MCADPGRSGIMSPSLQGSDGATGSGLWADMPDGETTRAAGKTTIGEGDDRIAQAHAHQSRGRGEHLAHTRTTPRAFITNDDGVTGLNFARKDARIASSWLS